MLKSNHQLALIMLRMQHACMSVHMDERAVLRTDDTHTAILTSSMIEAGQILLSS